MKGPSIQLRTSDIPICNQMCLFWKISGNLSYRTLVRMGHIMTIKPMTKGTATPWNVAVLKASSTPSANSPMSTPRKGKEGNVSWVGLL